MYNIEFVHNSFHKFDFEQWQYKKGNYRIANIVMQTNLITSFVFPSILQSETFRLQRFTLNQDTQEIVPAVVTSPIISNSYKRTGYFETHVPSTELTPGYYYIYTTNYKSKNIIYVKGAGYDKDAQGNTTGGGYPFVDNVGDYFVDNVGDYLIEIP